MRGSGRSIRTYTGLGQGQRTGAGPNKYQYDARGVSMQTAGTLLSETVSGSTYYLSDGHEVTPLTKAGSLQFDSSTGFYYTGAGGYYDPATGLQTGWVNWSAVSSLAAKHHKATKPKPRQAKASSRKGAGTPQKIMALLMAIAKAPPVKGSQGCDTGGQIAAGLTVGAEAFVLTVAILTAPIDGPLALAALAVGTGLLLKSAYDLRSCLYSAYV